MRVELKKLFFGPDGYRYKPGIHENMPDEWGKKVKGKIPGLPSSAKILPDLPVEEAEEIEVDPADQKGEKVVDPNAELTHETDPDPKDTKGATVKL